MAADDMATQLRKLARDMDAVGPKLSREIPKRMRKVAVPMVADIRAEARTLPERGGFAEYIAGSRITIQTRTSVQRAGVSVVGLRSKSGGFVDLRAVNRGRLRHPVFGDRDRWRTQQIRPGFWDRAIERRQQDVVSAMQAMMGEIRADLEKN